MFCDEHMNSYTILQRSQLLERFSAFKRRWFPADEAQQKVARVAVDALMTKRANGPTRVTHERNRTAREVERAAVRTEYDFHLMRRLHISRVLERMRGGD